MTFYLFHQNMRPFGGKNPKYNARMKTAFSKIKIGGPGSKILAAGFTEICNYGSAPAALENMMPKLDVGLTEVMTVAVGRTGSFVPVQPAKKQKTGSGTPEKTYKQEYLTMVTQRTVKWAGLVPTVVLEFAVQHWGKAIYLDNTINDGPALVGCFPTKGPGSIPAEDLPHDAKVDSRGIAYLVGQIKCAGDPLDKKWLVVCFMHNVYGVGDTSSGLTGMPRLVSAIYSKHGIVANVPCIVGGDFNTPPRPTGTGRTVRFVEAAELDPTNKNTPYNTTDSHPYDWWSCNVSQLDATPEIWPQTRKNTKPILSDHAGISLGLGADLWW